MSNRLQRWGERALGRVHSVSPRISSRFEPETGTYPFEAQDGFREIEVETSAPRKPVRTVHSEPVETIVSPSREPEIITEKPAPPRIIREEVPPPVAVEPPLPPPKVSAPAPPRTIVAPPALVSEEPEQPPRPAARTVENTPSARPEPPPTQISETSLVRLKRFEEWISTPPREKPTPVEASAPPPQAQVPIPPRLPAEARVPATTQLPPPGRPEPPPAPAPIVVSIGTIIVRANPSMIPKAVTTPPAAGLAAFLARRTAGQP
jgi:hypothetical protein